MKARFAIGLHHNWHDYNFCYDPLFDFHMAGFEDLKTADGSAFPLVPMDACNFSPPWMTPGGDKFWDILFVARAVKFKGIPEFFRAIRALYDRGKMVRVLFLCPVPPHGVGAENDVRKVYSRMFSPQEQELFTLLTMDFNYPFPLDLETLAHFYRASRIFVHSAPDERRCRVAAYAWATGLPVVGKACIGSVLPPELRHSPFFFEIDSYDQFPDAILAALLASRAQADFDPARREVATESAVPRMEDMLRQLFEARSWRYPATPVAGCRLDYRLGRHHGLSSGPNRIEQDIGRFIDLLRTLDQAELSELTALPDPENLLAKRYMDVPRRVPHSAKTFLQSLEKFGPARAALAFARHVFRPE